MLRFVRDLIRTSTRPTCAISIILGKQAVSDYYAAFEQLSHQILLYNSSYDDVFFVTRFLNGLREDIRAAITLHCPNNVDTANALDLLQE